MPVACVSSLAEERSACPNPTLRSSPTLWSDPGERVEIHIGRDLRVADGQKNVGKPMNQGDRRIEACSEAGDLDAKLGSRARECSSIPKRGRVETDDGVRRWKELLRDVVIALVNQETWRAAGP